MDPSALGSVEGGAAGSCHSREPHSHHRPRSPARPTAAQAQQRRRLERKAMKAKMEEKSLSRGVLLGAAGYGAAARGFKAARSISDVCAARANPPGAPRPLPALSPRAPTIRSS